MEFVKVFLVGVLWNLLTWVEGATIMQPELNGGNNALMYLSRFGYIDPVATNPEAGALLAQEKVSEAIRDFQAFAGLNQTGTLDEQTIEMMNTPRCGVVDKVGYGSNARRKKRYALQGSRWKVNDLTYKITKYPKLLTEAEVDYDIMKAFKVWSDITELTFSPVSSGKVHIEIRFERGEHGDGDAFDGAGGTLAHAYFPIYGGDAHFDDSEIWTVNNYRGTNLFQVAAHEFGHSLGLSHSDVQSALMAPFYRGYQSKFKLDNDDITAIQSLYGRKSIEPVPTKPSKPSFGGGDSTLCKDGSIDAIVSLADKFTYAFKGSRVWRLVDDGVAKGFPKRISETFSGLPSNLDAAFTWTNEKTYFFKGSQYWRTTGLTLDEGYPKSISKGFNGIPNNVDAAFVWSGNGKIYFFKGTNYYKFDQTQRPPVSSKYPKDLKVWEGLPYYIDDALQYSNGFTYFFKNGKYWRFNDRSFKVDNADPPFPRLSGPWWFGCPEKGSQKDDTNPDVNENEIPSTRTASSDDTIYDDTLDSDGSNDHYYYDSDLHPKYGAFGDYESGSSGPRNGQWAWIVVPFVLRLICL